MVLLYLAPESPWWLVRKGRYEDAEKSLRRLSSKAGAEGIRDTLTNMIRTNQIEREVNEKQGSYLDCFKSTNLRRTEISAICWSCGVFSGQVFNTNATYFFEQ